MKKLLLILLFVCSFFLVSCEEVGDLVFQTKYIPLNEELDLTDDVYVYINNNTVQEQYEFTYRNRKGKKTFDSIFSCYLSYKGEIWDSKYMEESDFDFELKCSNDKMEVDGSMISVTGETTIILSYKNVDEELKTLLLNNELNPNEYDGVSILLERIYLIAPERR